MRSIRRAIRLNLEDMAAHLLKKHKTYLSKSNILSVIRYMKKYGKYPIGVVRYIYYESPFRYDIQGTKSWTMMLGCENGYTNTVRFLLNDPETDPNINNGHALYLASVSGNAPIVLMLLQDPRTDPSGAQQDFRYAAYYGHLECVKILLADDRAFRSIESSHGIASALRLAVANNNNVAIVRLLLEHLPACDVELISYALTNACYYYSYDVVTVLLEDERVDPSADDNMALCTAYSRNTVGDLTNVEVVRRLLADDRVIKKGLASAISIAEKNKDHDTVDLLRRKLIEFNPYCTTP